MNGEYALLSNEQSWDGMNYLFQNLEGVRGVISFYNDIFVCILQNDDEYFMGENEIFSNLFCEVEENVCNLAKNEAIQYLMTEKDNGIFPMASAAFWGGDSAIYSNQSEKELIKKSCNILLPYLYDEADAIQHWKNYYEMSVEQVDFMKYVFNKKVNENSRIVLDTSMKEQLAYWFDNKIDECIRSFEELNIYFA